MRFCQGPTNGALRTLGVACATMEIAVATGLGAPASAHAVLSGIGRLTARTLGLPVEYYDEKYYNEVGSRGIGDWGSTSGSSGVSK